MKFLSPDVAPYLYGSTICPCMEYCCHVWAGTPSCYLGLFSALARKLKLAMFSQDWEIRLVFTKGCHHCWQQEVIFW